MFIDYVRLAHHMTTSLHFYSAASIAVIAMLLALVGISWLLEGKARRDTVGTSVRKHLVIATVVFAVFPPFLITLHELGHYLAAKAFGFKPVFQHSEVNFHADATIPKHLYLAVIIAGPLVEVLVGTIGLTLLLRRHRAEYIGTGLVYWITTAMSLAWIRWLRISPGGEDSDEVKISHLLAEHDSFVQSIMVLPAILGLATVFRIHRQNGTVWPLVTGLAAGVISASLWLRTLGPMIFPAPSKPEATEPERPLAVRLRGNWAVVGVPGGEVALRPSLATQKKTITATQFIVTLNHPKTGALLAWHGGTWQIKDGIYEETVLFGMEEASSLMNKTFRFKLTLEEDTLTIHGQGNPWNEVWKRVK